jgi:uncharacterized membrane protein YqhA
MVLLDLIGFCLDTSRSALVMRWPGAMVVLGELVAMSVMGGLVVMVVLGGFSLLIMGFAGDFDRPAWLLAIKSIALYRC